MAEGKDPYAKALKLAKAPNGNKEKVLELLEESYSQGNPEAAYALGTWYLHGEHVKKDLRKATGFLREAANSDVPDALYDLAVSYERGAGVKANPRKAFELFLRAALRGEKQSIYEIGRLYYYGIGIDKDKKLAKIWLDRAEEVGVKK